MKKFAPIIVVIGVVIAAAVAFALTRSTTEAPTIPEEAPGTTTETPGTSSEETPAAPSSGSPIGVGTVVKVYANPDWDIRFRYETSWNLAQNGEVVSVSAPSASFMISKEMPISEPSLLEPTTKTRTIAGQTVTVNRYDDPKAGYAFYEFFKLRVNKSEYYVKVMSETDSNEDVETFLGRITVQ